MFRSFIRLFKPKNQNNQDISGRTNIIEEDEEEDEPDNDIKVLLFGSPGSGKSCLLKRIRILNEYKNPEFLQEMEAEKKYIQYDIVTGILKVMARMMAYSEEDRYNLTENELRLYNNLNKRMKLFRAHGDFNPVTSKIGNNEMAFSIPKTSRKNKFGHFELPLSNDEWRRLERFTLRPDFNEILLERYIPVENLDNLSGKPLKLQDGFPGLVNTENIWSQLKARNPDLDTYLYIRRPNGGLPVKTVVQREFAANIVFTEFPGRIESFIDILDNLQREKYQAYGFNLVVLVLSFIDFDKEIETENDTLLLHDFMLEKLDGVNQAVKDIPLYLVFTKHGLLMEKLQAYCNAGILETQLKKSINVDIEENDVSADNKVTKFLVTKVAQAVSAGLHQRFTEIWGRQTKEETRKKVYKFPRALRMLFDDDDKGELLEQITQFKRDVNQMRLFEMYD